MKAYLNRIRSINGKISVKRRILNTFCVFVFGIALGIFSKYLDGVPGNVMPDIIAYLDFGNFLSRFAIWIFIAVCISVYSHTPLRAGLNVFVFFAGIWVLRRNPKETAWMLALGIVFALVLNRMLHW